MEMEMSESMGQQEEQLSSAGASMMMQANMGNGGYGHPVAGFVGNQVSRVTSFFNSNSVRIVGSIVAAVIALVVFLPFMYRLTTKAFGAVGLSSWKTATDGGMNPTMFGRVFHTIVLAVIYVAMMYIPPRFRITNNVHFQKTV